VGPGDRDLGSLSRISIKTACFIYSGLFTNTINSS